MTMDERLETRTLAVVIPEAEWKALLAVEPDAVAWLRSLIHTRLAPPKAAQVPEYDQYDGY